MTNEQKRAMYAIDTMVMDVVREIVAGQVLAERARCVAVCREVAAQHWATGKGGAAECAEAIERGAVGR